MMALIAKASSWPMTIASSPRPARLPRRSVGASSDRYTGTVTEAPPTAKPRITRDGIMTARLGASTPPRVPTKKRTARMVSVFFRPRASLSRAADERPDRGSDQQGARDQALARRGQPQVRLHRLQGAVDHAGVVTEEQAAERRDDRDQVEPPLVRTGCEWWQRDAAGLVHVHRCLRWRCPPRRAASREES